MYYIHWNVTSKSGRVTAATTFLSCEYMSGRLFSEIMLRAVVLEQLSPLVLLFLNHFEGFSGF